MIDQVKSMRTDDLPEVTFDPHTVLSDALNYTPWTEQGGHLPQKGEWSTYRYAAKDIIFGVVTFMFNQTMRRLDIRTYFVGEHPMFHELEPTRAMLTILSCQIWQTAKSLDLYFEGGIPFDVRELIERRIGKVLSGHDHLLSSEIIALLFADFSGFTLTEQEKIEREEKTKERKILLTEVCYNAYRGVWSVNNIKALIGRGVPLTWLFGKSPDAVNNSLSYWTLVQHLKSVLLEDYVLRRLEDRQFGETLGKKIERKETNSVVAYSSDAPIKLNDLTSNVNISAREPFLILSVVPSCSSAFGEALHKAITRAENRMPDVKLIAGLPLDFNYINPETRKYSLSLLAQKRIGWVLVSLTLAQLHTEIDQKIAITSEKYDLDEVEAGYVDRHTD